MYNGNNGNELEMLKNSLIQLRKNYGDLEVENYKLKEKINEQEKIIVNNASSNTK